MAACALWAGVWAYVFLLAPKHGDKGVAFNLFWAAIFTGLGVLIMAGGHVLASRHEKRSRGQLPRRPAADAGGQASQRLSSADPAGQLRPVDHGQQHTAEAARSGLFRPPLPGARSPRRWRPGGLLAPGPSRRAGTCNYCNQGDNRARRHSDWPAPASLATCLRNGQRLVVQRTGTHRQHAQQQAGRVPHHPPGLHLPHALRAVSFERGHTARMAQVTRVGRAGERHRPGAPPARAQHPCPCRRRGARMRSQEPVPGHAPTAVRLNDLNLFASLPVGLVAIATVG